MFNPNLSRARKELGFLYARLGDWEIAGQHLRAARDSGTLDPAQRAQIDAQLPEVEKRAAARSSVDPHADGRALAIECELLSGHQSFPDRRREPVAACRPRSDVNTFQLVHASHEYDFGGARRSAGDAMYRPTPRNSSTCRNTASRSLRGRSARASSCRRGWSTAFPCAPM